MDSTETVSPCAQERQAPEWHAHYADLGEPIDGWLPDEEVVVRIRKLLDSDLDRITTEEMDTFPDMDTGALVVFGVNPQDEVGCLIFVNAKLPAHLRVDLWGFCAGLAMGMEDFVEQCGVGTLRVSTVRLPISGPGADLLGAMMVRRLGGNTVGARFDVEPFDLGEVLGGTDG